MGDERTYQDVKAEAEFIHTLWPSYRGRRVEAVCTEALLGVPLCRDFQAGSVSAFEITAEGLVIVQSEEITILLTGYSGFICLSSTCS